MEGKIPIYSYSVLNTTDIEMDRFNELKQLAKRLEEICHEGEKISEGFVNLIGDVWVCYYRGNVSLQISEQNVSPIQYHFIKHLMSLKDYDNWKALTQGDALLSVLTSITIAEQLLLYLKQDAQVKKAAVERKINERKKELALKMINELNSFASNQFEADQSKFRMKTQLKILDNAKNEQKRINEVSQTKITQLVSKFQLSFTQSLSDLKKQQQAIVSMATIDGRKFESVSLKERLKIADTMFKNKLILEIAEMVGRFKKIARKKMKTKHNQTMERKNITLGNELSRLLASEYANYILPASRTDFLMRYAKSETLLLDTKGKDRRGKGPIIICIDESSSMNSIKAKCKAFCLTLLMIAKKQRRDFVIIPFASDLGNIHYFYKGNVDTDELFRYCKQFLGGGTNYEKPLRETLTILLNSRFNDADVLFVTDGSSFLTSSFVEEFNKIKQKRKFTCIAVVLSNLYQAVDISVVEKFSDKVIEVNNLFEAGDAFAI